MLLLQIKRCVSVFGSVFGMYAHPLAVFRNRERLAISTGYHLSVCEHELGIGNVIV